MYIVFYVREIDLQLSANCNQTILKVLKLSVNFNQVSTVKLLNSHKLVLLENAVIKPARSRSPPPGRMTAAKTMAVVALALVLAAVPCSGQVQTFLASEMMAGCECMGDNSALGEPSVLLVHLVLRECSCMTSVGACSPYGPVRGSVGVITPG